MAYRVQNPVGLLFYRGSSSSNLVTFAAILRASSFVSSLAADPIGFCYYCSPKEAAHLGVR
jgi:hypothetical protein